jgi:crossover junction endodeoxyribonuclease RuvC
MGRTTSRSLWTAKLTGKPVASRSRLPDADEAGALRLARPFAGMVLGIDPSLRGTGLAIVHFQPGQRPLLLRSATVRVPAGRTMAHALAQIHRAVGDFLERQPEVVHVALEQTIYVQNFQTAQILGAARGAAISAAAIRDLPVFEYPPMRVKLAVAGSGRATKEQVARIVLVHLGHEGRLGLDESDAAGVALCHGFTWRP